MTPQATKAGREKYSLTDFFGVGTQRQPAKSRLRKMIERALSPVAPGTYKREKPGNLVRIQPRTFRRGRIRWVKGQMQTGHMRTKTLSSKVSE